MSYQQLSTIYDRFMGHAPYNDWLAFTLDQFEKSQENIHTIADLGCGTGEITIKLAEKGYEIFGIDKSNEMLVHAAHKANFKGLDIQWLNQDIRDLDGISEMDAIISYCDVINYVTRLEDVERVFNHVWQSLRVGGLFLFDVHALTYVEQHLINHSFSDVLDDMAYIWDCFPGDVEGEMYHEITFFSKTIDGTYQRFDEQHHQRTYSIQTYYDLLTKIGFKNIHFYGDFNRIIDFSTKNVERIFFIGQK